METLKFFGEVSVRQDPGGGIKKKLLNYQELAQACDGGPMTDDGLDYSVFGPRSSVRGEAPSPRSSVIGLRSGATRPYWRTRRDSNPQPADSKSDALSIELRVRVGVLYRSLAGRSILVG